MLTASRWVNSTATVFESVWAQAWVWVSGIGRKRRKWEEPFLGGRIAWVDFSCVGMMIRKCCSWTVETRFLLYYWLKIDKYLQVSSFLINVISNWVTDKVSISFIWVFLTIYSSFFEQVWGKTLTGFDSYRVLISNAFIKFLLWWFASSCRVI